MTPAAALVALAAALPLAAYLRRERAARRVRATLGLEGGAPGSRRAVVATLVAVPALLGLAAAQPVIERGTAVKERADAEILFVVDTSRSMAASAAHDEPTRFDRARDAALEIRARLDEFPAGIASLTDRTLPHLFPTIDSLAFRATFERSVGIQRPGPSQFFVTVATDLSSLAAVATKNFFATNAPKRLAIVLTDGETQPMRSELASALSDHDVRVAFVHVSRPGERIFVSSAPEAAYRSNPQSERNLSNLAARIDGAVFDEEEVREVVAYARGVLGEGPTRERRQRDLLALMPYVTAVAFLPLAVVLRRRNV